MPQQFAGISSLCQHTASSFIHNSCVSQVTQHFENFFTKKLEMKLVIHSSFLSLPLLYLIRRLNNASSESDNGYTVLSGTSIACPHVAGLTTLLLSKDKNIQINRLKDCIMESAQPTNPRGGHCGGIPDDQYPNFHAGHGRISAPVSLKLCFP